MALPASPVVLVTGATDGIGRTTALTLTRRGARVIVHGRRADRVEATVSELGALAGQLGFGAPPAPLVLDLSDLAQVRTAGARLDERGVAVDVLLNNAGIYMRAPGASAQGFELTFAVNHLAPFALTHALLASRAGASLQRIVNVSSMAQARGALVLDDLSFERRGFDAYATYAASKLANVVFSFELARRLRSRAVDVNALHPGVVSTKLLTEGFGMQGSDSLEDAAATSVRLALDADVAGVTGRYFRAGAPAPHARAADDRELARRFYERSAELCGVSPLAADD